MPTELSNKALDFIRRTGMLEVGDKVLLAVSGGVDSTVMFQLFWEFQSELGIHIGIAHFDHGLRGEESDRDREFVRALAEGRGLEFHVEQASLQEETGEGSLQIRARARRFDFFYRVMERYGYNKLSLGHNRDDQTETVLMALLRGYGFSGLSGIKPVSGRHIHPLLDFTREEIEEYAREKGCRWVEDSSNRKTDYLRNKVRWEILPQLKKAFPRCDKALADLGGEAQNIYALIQIETDKILQRVAAFTENQRAELDIDLFLKYIVNLRKYALLRIIRRLAPDYRPTPAMLEEVDKLCLARTGSVVTAGPLEIVKDRGALIFSFRFDEEIGVQVEVDRDLVVHGMLFHLEPSPVDRVKFTSDRAVEYIDLDAVRGQLVLRSWQAGDRFHPLGMEGKCKVSDYLVNSKVSVLDKKRVLALCDEEKILWLCGMRLDDRVKISSATNRALKLVYLRASQSFGG